MWSRIVLCLFLGFAYAKHGPAWNVEKEYLYNVHGRTLALLSEKSNEYSGIIINATLRVQPVSDGKIRCEIQEPIYSQILSKLPYWHVPSSENWNWRPLQMFSKPFEVEYENGVITDLIVSKSIPNWEVNMIKSIVSQFQLNTKAENIIESSMNILPEQGKPSATYKTMEQTVTGNTETYYSVNQMPQYVLQATPKWAKHLKHYNPEHPVFEIVKYKNYTNHIQLPSYIHGLGSLYTQQNRYNQYGEIMSRECMSNALVTGHMDDFTVHTSSTTEIFAIKPLLSGKETSSVVSYMHIHLAELRNQQDKIESIVNPASTGGLVYSYAVSNSNPKLRSPEEGYQIQPSSLDQPPQNPLLPFNVGYQGISIKNKIDIVKQIVKQCQKIGYELQGTSSSIRGHILNQFTTLIPQVRLMNVEELNQAFEQLHTKNTKGHEYASWSVFRDLVGESGTGPALLIIKEWLMNSKISTSEAADLLTTIARTVRQPTDEFMRTIFEIIKSPPAQDLSRSVVLSYAALIRKVYVARSWKTHFQYAAQTFGAYSADKSFATNEVIPYFARQLHLAISNGDTKKIHTYIRCLGNTGHPMILAELEPYLEGDKRCSQFQRMLMVLSMERILSTSPDLTVPVLFKIYRNVGEQQEVRIAAAFLIMRSTKIPADMLKSIALYTNIDKHDHVNAAIASGIKNFASQNHGIFPLTHPARAAQPFLNQKTYGPQYGGKTAFEFFSKEMQDVYAVNFEAISTESESYPKNFDYHLFHGIAGILKRSMAVEGSISSIEELIHELTEQTKSYQEQKHKKESARSQPYSSETIAKLLNITIKEREQLEGFLYTEAFGYIESLSFNNHSLEYLPEAIRYIEQELREGQRFNTIKFRNWENMKIAFPTAMGLPFLYTYNQPSLLRAQGQIKASAKPQIFRENTLNTPDTLKLEADVNVAFAHSQQGILSFTTPFDHQQYICGFERLFKSHIPVRGGFDLDTKNMRVKLQLQPELMDKESQLFHHSTWPVTSRFDLLNTQSIPKEPNTRVWRSKTMRSYERTVGEKQSGASLRIKMNRDRKYMDMSRIPELIWKEGPLDTLISLYNIDQISQSRMDIYLVPQQSTNNKIVLHFGQKQQKREEYDNDWNLKSSTTADDKISNRLTQVMELAVKDMQAGQVTAYDLCAQFEGRGSSNYSSTIAFAKTWAYPTNVSYIVMLKQKSDQSEEQPFEFIMESRTSQRNANIFDVEEAMTKTPSLRTQVDITFGRNEEPVSKVRADIGFERSEERTEYIKKQPFSEQCERESEEGNKQLHACMDTRLQANKLDKMNMLLHLGGLSKEGRQMAQYVQSLMSKVFQAPRLQDDELAKLWSMKAQFDPDLKYLNVSAKCKSVEFELNNINVNEYVREILVPSAYLKASTRFIGQVLGRHVYRPLCTVDKTRISNFNNITFPADLTKDWTVMLQYVPQQARQGEEEQPTYKQLKSQLRNLVVLVRENENSGRDVKIVHSSPETAFENTEISLTSERGIVKVYVNGQDMLTKMEPEIKLKYGGYVVLRRYSSNHVVVLIRDTIILHYNGQAARLLGKSYSLANSVRGICGQLNQEPNRDFVGPEDCITRDYKKFIRSYELSQEGERTRENLSGNIQECVPQHETLFADVISDNEAQRGLNKDDCIRFQTLYTEDHSETCFTSRLMPVCSERCTAYSTTTKNVAVYCVAHSPTSRLWKGHIKNGASLDFSRKPVTKTVPMELPQKCAL